jgi:hypothetical protein
MNLPKNHISKSFHSRVTWTIKLLPESVRSLRESASIHIPCQSIVEFAPHYSTNAYTQLLQKLLGFPAAESVFGNESRSKSEHPIICGQFKRSPVS